MRAREDQADDAPRVAGEAVDGGRVGVGAGVPSWGHSLATSVRFISIYPLTVLWPGLVVTMTVIALHLFGDALRDAIDPLTNPELREAA